MALQFFLQNIMKVRNKSSLNFYEQKEQKAERVLIEKSKNINSPLTSNKTQ